MVWLLFHNVLLLNSNHLGFTSALAHGGYFPFDSYLKIIMRVKPNGRTP